MKKLLFLFVSIVLLSCSQKPKPEVEEEDDFLKVPETKIEAPTTNYTPVSGSISTNYWYVVMYEDSTNTTWHRAIKISTPYFDFVEARNQIPEALGKCYFEFFTPISVESYESFLKHKASEN